MSEEKKQKLKEYQKKSREAKKSKYNNIIVINIIVFFNYDLIVYAMIQLIRLIINRIVF